jgi:IMP dehydrogenase
MVKEIIWKPARTFSEFTLNITESTSKKCNISTVNLEARLTHDDNLKSLVLGIPFISAAMTCVTGYEMAVALGKERGISVLPTRWDLDYQTDIVKKIKEYNMGFVDEPQTVDENQTINDALELVEKHGHSKIPVINRDNYFLGIFDQQYFFDSDKKEWDNVKEGMIPFNNENSNIAYTCNENITVQNARRMLNRKKHGKKADYLVILDRSKRMRKLAFRKDFETIKVASAISTHKGWKKRAQANIDAGVDMVVVDTSDGLNEYEEELIKKYKKMDTGIPLCAGNVISYEGTMKLLEWGADIIKEGMSSGSICTTAREKATGRAPFTSLYEVYRAREDYLKKTGNYKAIIADGGISTSGDMIIALTMADSMMMGGYFNHFYESAGTKLDKEGEPTKEEDKIRWVITYGEGSDYAKSLGRYGHASKKTFFPEGEYGRIPYKGRLKPNLNKDIKRIKAALVNTNAMNLVEYRKKAVLELLSETSQDIVKQTHHMEVTGK